MFRDMGTFRQYPSCYHAAFNALIYAPDAQGTRDAMARVIRFYRQHQHRTVVRELVGRMCFVGWPVKARPNGRYR